MLLRNRAVPSWLVLTIGVTVGWTLAAFRPAPVQADRGGPGGEDLIASGPVAIEHNAGLKIQVPHDAVYYLDYKGGRLLAVVPSLRQTVGGTQMLGSFAERDLVKDFKLTPGSSTPHFLMTTGTLGALNGAWGALYVFETSTKQVATYRVFQQTVGGSPQPRFDLLEVRSMAPVPPAVAN
jgi:hypothetical protein